MKDTAMELLMIWDLKKSAVRIAAIIQPNAATVFLNIAKIVPNIYKTGGDKLTAREYLHQMKTLKYQIKVKKLELEGLCEDMQTIRSPTFGDKVQGGRCGDFVDQIAKASELESDIKAETAKKIDILHDIHFKIKSVGDELSAALLTDRYINNRSSDEVAKDTNYAAAYVRKLTADAIELFKAKYGDVF